MDKGIIFFCLVIKPCPFFFQGPCFSSETFVKVKVDRKRYRRVSGKDKNSYLLFYHKKVAKSSVKGLSMGAPLLKTDRFGDPAASSRYPVFQFALLHA